MAPLAFYDLNSGRGYPFVEIGPPLMLYSGGGYAELPKSAVVGCVVILGHGSGFTPEHRAYLYEIRRSSDRLTYEFRFSAPAMLGISLLFTREVDTQEFAVTRAASDAEGGSSTDAFCSTVLVEGWLSTGDQRPLAATLADGEWLRRADQELYLEPARVQTLDGLFVNSINLANADRTRADYEECVGVEQSSSSSSAVISESYSVDVNSSSQSLDNRSYVVNATCLRGPLRFSNGYNVDIRQDNGLNTLTFSPGVGSGAGEPCEEVPLYAGETPPAGSRLLSGGPACNELIKTINGVGGPNLRLVAGAGVRLAGDGLDPYKIRILLDHNGLAVCPGGQDG